MRRGLSVVALACLVTSCTSLLGVNDIYFDPSADGGGGADGGGMTSSEGGADGADGAVGPAPTCPPSTDLKKDPKNCGRCGHDCLGGPCSDGVCGATIIVDGLDTPGVLATNATHLYFTVVGGGIVARANKDGTGRVDITTGQTSPFGIALDATNVYWSTETTNGTINKCPLAPPCTPSLVYKTAFPRSLGFRNGYLYWASRNGADSTINRVKPDGSDFLALVPSGPQLGTVAVDDTNAYYLGNGNFMERVRITGGTTEQVGPHTLSFAGIVAVDDARAYWTGYNIDGEQIGKLQSRLKAGGPVVEYNANRNKRSFAVVADGQQVFWVNQGTFTGTTSDKNGEVLACPSAGCAANAIPLAAGLVDPTFITQDATAVYFSEAGNTTTNGRIWRVAKP